MTEALLKIFPRIVVIREACGESSANRRYWSRQLQRSLNSGPPVLRFRTACPLLIYYAYHLSYMSCSTQSYLFCIRISVTCNSFLYLPDFMLLIHLFIHSFTFIISVPGTAIPLPFFLFHTPVQHFQESVRCFVCLWRVQTLFLFIFVSDILCFYLSTSLHLFSGSQRRHSHFHSFFLFIFQSHICKGQRVFVCFSAPSLYTHLLFNFTYVFIYSLV